MSDYDTDIVRWSEHQAHLLRRRSAGELVNDVDLDWPNIAEEIESVGRSERSALASHIGTIIEHLLKLEASPASAPRAGWKETVLRTRTAVDDILEESPSLKPAVDAAIIRALKQRRRLVSELLALYGETPCVDVAEVAYSADQVLGLWFPKDPS
jgi:hypothetical protein